MLDRLISGAGAVTDGADRSVRLLATGRRRRFAATRPGFDRDRAHPGRPRRAPRAGRSRVDRSADPGHPRAGRRRERERERPPRPDLRDLDGSVHSVYVETYLDANDNGAEDADEDGVAWYYWLVDRGSGPA